MAWNEPGGSNNDNDKDKEKNRDPWGGPPKGNGAGRDEGPPSLDEVFDKIKAFFNKLFGDENSSKRNNNNYNGKSGGTGGFSPWLIALALAVIVCGVWLSKAIYIIDQQEEALILRFGKYHEKVGPGLHIYFPPMDVKYLVNVTAERSYSKTGRMLTKDENIVEIPLTVQFRINDLEKFLLKNDNAELSLENATDSALRQVAGSTTMDQILTSGRSIMATNIQTTLEDMLNKYETGITITQINIQSATAPVDIQKAFDDVIRAREDQQRSQNRAETYEKGVVPAARGEAARVEREAEGYLAAVVDRAEGEAARFNMLLVAYKQAPEITRQRMYLETIQEVLSKTSKVLVSAGDGKNQLIYLPIDKLMNATTTPNVPNPSSIQSTTTINPQQSTEQINTNDLRTRGGR